MNDAFTPVNYNGNGTHPPHTSEAQEKYWAIIHYPGTDSYGLIDAVAESQGQARQLFQIRQERIKTFEPENEFEIVRVLNWEESRIISEIEENDMQYFDALVILFEDPSIEPATFEF